MKRSQLRPGLRAAIAAMLLAWCALPGASALGRTAVGAGSVPGLENVPWAGVIRGTPGEWARYRVGNEEIQQTTFMTLVLVELEDEEAAWIEVRLARSRSLSSADMTVLARMVSSDEGTKLDRALLRMAGGSVLELDLGTVTPDENADEAAALAGACTMPESSACQTAISRGLDVQARPEETRLTAAGSLRVTPVQVRLQDGGAMRFLVSESVPVTALVAASSPDGTHLELDGVGSGAVSTMPREAPLVTRSELGDALSRGVAAGGSLTQIGRKVNPDEEERGPLTKDGSRHDTQTNRQDEARGADGPGRRDAQ